MKQRIASSKPSYPCQPTVSELRSSASGAVSAVDKQTRGAWIVHHGRKIAVDQQGAAEYSAIDVAAKAAGLLARLAESNQATLSKVQVEAVAKAGGLNPKTELGACREQLERRRLIDRASDGALSVLGISGRTALGHASDIFDDNAPEPIELAAIDLAELAPSAPPKGSSRLRSLSATHISWRRVIRAIFSIKRRK